MCCESFVFRFEVWRKYPANIVTLTPRWFGISPGNIYTYLRNNQDPRRDPHSGGYFLSPSTSMMIHRRYLRHYACNRGVLRDVIHRTVDIHRNCEDIGFNVLVHQVGV